ncbi:hypothetical protein SUGI_0392140 [Cryptomeria japonica]|nr:hypothetical protein SUGI_0392140 [Cryptomeria japonica]
MAPVTMNSPALEISNLTVVCNDSTTGLGVDSVAYAVGLERDASLMGAEALGRPPPAVTGGLTSVRDSAAAVVVNTPVTVDSPALDISNLTTICNGSTVGLGVDSSAHAVGLECDAPLMGDEALRRPRSAVTGSLTGVGGFVAVVVDIPKLSPGCSFSRVARAATYKEDDFSSRDEVPLTVDDAFVAVCVVVEAPTSIAPAPQLRSSPDDSSLVAVSQQ